MRDKAAVTQLNEKLTAALMHAHAGFSVFPLIPNDKRPLIENWQNLATTEERNIIAWWSEEPEANIGICTGDLLVVDVDPRNGGNAGFEDLVMSGGLVGDEFPLTLASGTQGGGTHMFYKLPQGVQVRGGTNKLAKGVDIKSHGGYVVAPGSTIDGRAYRWKPTYAPGQRPLAEAPAWLIARCNAAKPKSPDAGKVIVAEDDSAIALAEDWLARNAPDAIQGGRDDAAFTVAARLYDFGISPETCRELLLQWNEGWCHPPLETDAIDRIVWSARKNRENAVGAKHPSAPGFDVVNIAERVEVGIPATKDTTGFFHPARRFKAADLPLRPWVIPGFACRARVSMLAGPGGVAKSTYTLMVAVAVAAQRDDICGFPVPKREKVAVWNQEDDLEEMQRRLAAIMEAFKVSWADIEDEHGEPMLHLNSGVDNPLMLAMRTTEGSIRPSRQVAAAIADIKAKGISLLVLDPLVEMHEAVENDNVQMRAVVSLVRDVAVQGNCAVILATHTKKPPVASSDGFAGEMDAARGASSQFGVIRVGATLFSASPKDAKAWRMTGSHLDYVRLDIAKNNLAQRTGEPMWFKRDSIMVGGFETGGESVGVLRPIDLKRKQVEVSHHLPELIAKTIATTMETDVWHTTAAVAEAVSEDDKQNFPDFKNRSRMLDEAFDGADEIATNYGTLRRIIKGGRTGTRYLLTKMETPQTPQNGGEVFLTD